ncbi:hypothetical protein Dxin01_00121 [Deinococcus xinjiangensis]|uniref:DUF2314 domain-containing protein n=1 Tax=Deinococcus xinjiangensis TaxID=457454 RepID=A0ABP9V538_9DEIO
MSWTLAKVQPLADMYPEAVKVHPAAHHLMPGDTCQIWLVPETSDVLRHPLKYGEKFWVHVLQRTEKGYVGQLCHPLVLTSMRAGALIRFTHEHVLDVQED